MLGFFRAGYHHTGRQVGNAHSRIGLIDVLTTRATGAIGIDAQIRIIDIDLDILDLRQDRDRGRRGMDSTLRLSIWHALHPVHAAFKLQAAKHAVAIDRGNDFLKAARIAFGQGLNLDPPALKLGIALIHTKKVAREQGRLVAAGPGPHLQYGRGVFVLVLGCEQQGHFALKGWQTLVQGLQLILGHGYHFGIT